MRYQVQTKLLDNAEYTIYNPLSINWKMFRWVEGLYRHYVTSDEIYKFYLVPYTYYGTVEYADIILLLNNVPTEFELYPGTELMIPKLTELESFILKYSKE